MQYNFSSSTPDPSPRAQNSHKEKTYTLHSNLPYLQRPPAHPCKRPKIFPKAPSKANRLRKKQVSKQASRPTPKTQTTQTTSDTHVIISRTVVGGGGGRNIPNTINRIETSRANQVRIGRCVVVVAVGADLRVGRAAARALERRRRRVVGFIGGMMA